MVLKPLRICASAALGSVVFLFNTAIADTPGALDETFDPGANDEVLSFRLVEGDRFLATGLFTVIGGVTIGGVARLDTDGEVDETFDVGVGANQFVAAVNPDATGRWLIGGNFDSFDGEDRTRVARLSEDGELDETFVPPTDDDKLNLRVLGVASLESGSVVVGGWFFSVGDNNLTGVAGLNEDGSLDGNFNAGGSGANDQVDALMVIEVDEGDGPEERILAAGIFTQYNSESRNRIALLNPDGTLADDATFSVGTGFNGRVRTLSPGRDGTIYAGGDFSAYRSTTQPGARLVRILPNGDRDDDFRPAAPNGTVWAIAEDAEGRVIIAGDFTEVGGEPRNRIARLLPGGELDQSFEQGGGANDRVSALAIQENGSILLGGRFTNYDGTPRDRIARVLGGGEVLEPESGYDTWAQDFFTDPSISGPEHDADGDGILNLLEYAFDGNPNQPFTATLPSIASVTAGNDEFLEITFLRINADDLIYRVEGSDKMDNMADWDEIWISTEHPMGAGEESVIETVTDSEPIGLNDSRFLRVMVVLE